MSKGDRKADYFVKVHTLFRTYSKVFVIGVDNVTSAQMHQIRTALRADAVMLMGKNTLVKRAMKEIVEELPQIEALVPLIKGNVGLVFTNGDLKTVRDKIVTNTVAAPAKVGVIAQCNVTVPAGNTGISPDKTSFFQALGINTKVVKGAIEITSDVLLLKEGDRVGASEAELLTMLNITPFKYGCVVFHVYDNGSVFEQSMLDITDEVVLKHMSAGIRNVAALSMAIHLPTLASVPHLLVNGYKNLLGLSLVSDVTFPAADKLKEALKNAPAAGSAPAAAAAPAGKAAAVEVKEEVKEESDEELGLSLFD